MIGEPLKVRVLWYDKVPEPPVNTEHEGEVISWRDTQVVVRVKGYCVLRFWKKSGMEVGNRDYVRRGFFLAVDQLNSECEGKVIQSGIQINMEE